MQRALLGVLRAGALLWIAMRGATAQNAPAPASAGCVVRETSRTPLTVDGREMYIEPTVVLRSGPDILLAGRPNYLFDRGPLTVARDFTVDSVFGAIIDRQGRTRLVPAPIAPALVAFTRAIALPTGGWAMVFAELKRPWNPPAVDTIARLWYGEFDGTRWSALEQLPEVPGRLMDLEYGSELVRHGDSLYIAARVISRAANPGDMALFARHQGRWSVSLVPTIAAAYGELLPSDSLGLAMIVVQADRSLGSDVNSMFLYAKQPEWRILRKLVHGGSEPVYEPRLLSSPGGMVLSWFILDRGALPPTNRARAMIGLGDTRDGQIVELDPDINHVTPVVDFTRFPIWVTDHNASPQQRTLRFLTDSAGHPRELASIPNPFTGFSAATALSASEILVSGPLFHADPARPRLVSLLIRMRVECSRSAP